MTTTDDVLLSHTFLLAIIDTLLYNTWMSKIYFCLFSSLQGRSFSKI